MRTVTPPASAGLDAALLQPAGAGNAAGRSRADPIALECQ